MAKQFTLSEKDHDRLQAVLIYVEGMMKAKIPGGQNTPKGPSFPSSRNNERNFGDNPDWIWIKIGTAHQDGSNKRWKYEWVQVRKTDEGYGQWDDDWDEALSGPVDGYGYAYNGCEEPNGSSGTYGNGSSSSNFIGTLDIQKITAGVIVRAFAVRPDADDALVELWFVDPNGVDGGCS